MPETRVMCFCIYDSSLLWSSLAVGAEEAAEAQKRDTEHRHRSDDILNLATSTIAVRVGLESHHLESAEGAVLGGAEVAQAGVPTSLDEERFHGFRFAQTLVQVHLDGERPVVETRAHDANGHLARAVLHHTSALVRPPRDFSVFVCAVKVDELIRKFQEREQSRGRRRRDGLLAVLDGATGVLERSDKIDHRDRHLAFGIAIDPILRDVLGQTVLVHTSPVAGEQLIQSLVRHRVHEQRGDPLDSNSDLGHRSVPFNGLT